MKNFIMIIISLNNWIMEAARKVPDKASYPKEYMQRPKTRNFILYLENKLIKILEKR
jgi:hypothetical protein